jgi:Ca2+/Na+ antiporter
MIIAVTILKFILVGCLVGFLIALLYVVYLMWKLKRDIKRIEHENYNDIMQTTINNLLDEQCELDEDLL